jgi:hypothetical protein
MTRAAMKTGFVERCGKLAELDRSFDLKFWQEQPAQARFDAAWELIVHAVQVKGGDVRQLRLQRSVEAFQRQPGQVSGHRWFAEAWPRRLEVDFDGFVDWHRRLKDGAKTIGACSSVTW